MRKLQSEMAFLSVCLATPGAERYKHRTDVAPISLNDVRNTVVDKTNPVVAELFDYINTLNIIVRVEEGSDKKVKRVNGIIRDYCRAKIKEAKHEGTKIILREISKPALCRVELRKAVTALNIIESEAKEVITFKE